MSITASPTNSNNAGSNSWQWYTLAGNGDTTAIAGQSTPTLSLDNVTTTTSYRVVAVNKVGDCVDTAYKDVTVTVLNPSVESPTFTGNNTICQGNSTSLKVS